MKSLKSKGSMKSYFRIFSILATGALERYKYISSFNVLNANTKGPFL